MDEQPKATGGGPDAPTRQFYLHSLEALDQAGVPYLVGGGYAMLCHTGILRDTKDLDVFVRPADSRRTLDTLAGAGYRTEWTWPHFLGKAMFENAFVDVIFNSGNGLCPVDGEWFSNAAEGTFLGRRVWICPAEETLWSKAFVMERDRYDGADVAHLILRHGERFDWKRLLRRFQGHERVLLSHLVLFGYIYPSERRCVPEEVLAELQQIVSREQPGTQRICRGTVLAQHQYRPDVQQWGFADARMQPLGPLRPDDIARFAPPDAQPLSA